MNAKQPSTGILPQLGAHGTAQPHEYMAPHPTARGGPEQCRKLGVHRGGDVLTSGCAWRMLPPSFGVTVPTAHRRFTVWTNAGVWRRPHRAVLDELGSEGLIDWSRAVIDAASVRAH